MFNTTNMRRKRAILPAVLLLAVIMLAGCLPFTPLQNTEEAAALNTPGATKLPEVTEGVTPEITPEITSKPTPASTGSWLDIAPTECTPTP
ncbi:MAG: hypothetical protein II739_06930, partial [Clostridia bacterium]|nr:hypothetical protein [Clostridia bacterium]